MKAASKIMMPAAPGATDDRSVERSRRRQSIPVLLYHSVSSAPSSWISRFTVAPSVFARHMQHIADSGRVALTASELALALEGQVPLPRKVVVITFDDGFADTLEVAAPILRDHRFGATAFVTSGFVGRRSPGGDRMLTWSAVRELDAAGFEIGAHAVTHAELDTLSERRARAEIAVSRTDLQHRLAAPVESFAYPYGFASARSRELVRQAGYRVAYGVRNAFSHPGDRILQLARLTVTDSTSEARFLAWLDGLDAPLAASRDAPRTYAWRAYRRARATLSHLRRRQLLPGSRC